MAVRKRAEEKQETVKQIGRYIVSDPKICHGALTFRGTRILAGLVLDQVAQGLPWEHIVDEWYGKVPREAIAEAVRRVRDAFFAHAEEYAPAGVHRRAG